MTVNHVLTLIYSTALQFRSFDRVHLLVDSKPSRGGQYGGLCVLLAIL